MAPLDHLSEVRASRRPGSDHIAFGHRLGHLELAIKILYSLVLSDTFELTDLAAFQSVFGMVFTVIIALEFKRTLVLVTERTESVVQVRAVILIALLAIVRKLIILDISPSDAPQLLALAVAILSLGGVYWLVRDQDRREQE
jgi:uncharacterized membrane protein (DUF373 family)